MGRVQFAKLDAIRSIFLTILLVNFGTGAVITIVNIAYALVAKSGRVPLTLITQVPAGFDYKTNILPSTGFTPIRSFAGSRGSPSEFLTPEYVQELAYEPQLRVAKNGDIGNNILGTPWDAVKVVNDQVTLFTVNGPKVFGVHHQLMFVSFD